MYYNRILSARLKGLKKEMLLKNRQHIKKKVYIYTIELCQASIFLFFPFSFKKCGISNESNVIFCELGHYLLS